MLYVSKIDKGNNLVCVTDSDDGIVDKVSLSELRKIVNLGVVVNGAEIKDGKLGVKKFDYLGSLIAKLTTFGNYEEFGCFRFNSEYNIYWVFKDVVLDDPKTSFFKRDAVRNTLQFRLYVLPNVTRLESLFNGCRDKSLDLSSFNTSNVTDMIYMFVNCRTESLDLSSFDTSNVTTMRNMFYECKVKSLDLSSFNTRNVTDMRQMFMDCRAESLDLFSFDTRNVTDMSQMFSNCKFKSLDFSSFDTRKVTNMSYMFYRCKVETLDISSFDTSSVTNMDDMFEDCQISRIRVRDARIIEQLKKDLFEGEIIQV